MSPARSARKHLHRPSRQRGQSLVEMAIACIVLVPLAAGVMLLGQYIHLREQTRAAARQAAWAATVDPALVDAGLPGRAAVQRDLRSRQFAEAKTVLRSHAAAPAAFGDSMLTTFANQPLLKTSGLTLSVYRQEAAPTYLDDAMAIVGKAGRTLGNLPPNPKGLVTAEAHVKPEKLIGSDGLTLDFLGSIASEQLDFSARSVVLADTWAATGGGEKRNGDEVSGALSNRTVRHVIRPLVPSDWLGSSLDDAFSNAIHLLEKIPIVGDIFTPGFDGFELGKTSPDVVPTDKLVKYRDVR